MSTRKRYLSLAEQAVALDAYRHIALRAARRVSRSLQLGAPDHEDARQQALVGLLVAARTFDRTAGITFGVHAWHEIRRELRRFFRAHQRRGFTCIGTQPLVVLSIFDSPSVDGLPIEDRLAASEDTAEARCDAMAALAVLEDRERRILSLASWRAGRSAARRRRSTSRRSGFGRSKSLQFRTFAKGSAASRAKRESRKGTQLIKTFRLIDASLVAFRQSSDRRRWRTAFSYIEEFRYVNL